MRWFSFILLATLLLSGCAETPSVPAATATTDAAVTTGATPTGESYPVPAYPEPTALGAYPPPTEVLPQGPQFTINTPLRVADGQISGTGQAGVPLRIVNITQDSTVIATTTIGDDGTYSVAISGVSANDLVGIMLGDTQGTTLNPNDFLRGPGYQDLPLIGIVFDSEIAVE